MSDRRFITSLHRVSRLDGLVDVLPIEKEQITEQLAQGLIPNILRESWNLVDENTEIAKKFQTTMERITQKLLDDAGEKIDIKAAGIRFMLCNDHDPNAGVVTWAVPPIMMFSHSLLAKLHTLDQLESVIGHELGHKVFHDKIGRHSNSKGEEMFVAEGYGTYLLFKAKRNVEASKEVQELLSQERSEQERWIGYIDPHLNDPLHMRLLENGYEAIKETFGGYTTESMPMDPEITQYRYFDYKTIFERELEMIGYNNFSLEEKVDWLIKQIPLAEKWKDAGYEKRAWVFGLLLGAARYECKEKYEENADNLPEAEKYLTLKSKLIEAAAKSKSYDFYISTCSYLDLYEPFEILRKASEDFVNSDDPEIIAKAAADITKVLEARPYRVAEDYIISKLRLARFPFPKNEVISAAEKFIMEEFMATAPSRSDHDILYAELCEKHGVLVPWDKHIKLYQKTGNEQIAYVARLFGVMDVRLPKLPEDAGVKPPDYLNSLGWASKEDLAHPVISKLQTEPGILTIGNIGFSDHGKIVSLQHNAKVLGFNEEDPVKARLYEEFRLMQENAALKAAAERTNFTEMEQDFWGFVERNKAYLRPVETLTGAECNNYFAERFTETLTDLIKKEPARFAPIAYEFFSGRDSVQRTPIFQNNAAGKITLPIMLEESSNDPYIKYAVSGITAGISLQNPYFRFMREDKFNIFSSEDRLILWQFANYTKKLYKAGDKIADLFDQEVISMHANLPTSYAETVAACEDIIRLAKDAYSREIFAYDFTIESPGMKYFVGSEHRILHANLNAALLDRKAPYNLEELKRLDDLYEDFGCAAFSDEKEYRENILKVNYAQDFSDNTTADELLARYDHYVRKEYFEDNPELRREYQAKLLQRKNELSTSGVSDMEKLCQSMLQHHKFTSPEFDKLLIDHWNKCKQRSGNPDAAKITAELLEAKVPIVRVHDMMAQLAENCQLQPSSCYEIERQLQNSGLSELPESHLKAVTAEIVIDLVGQDAKVRQQLLEYFSKSATPQTTRETVEIINKAAEKSFRKWTKKNSSDYLSEKEKEDIVSLMHENYCSWPIQWQAVYLEKILFPVNNKLAQAAGINVTIESETQNILNKIFPPEKENSKITRDFIECYLEQHTEAGQRLILSIVMAASREGEFDNLENISPMRQAGRTVGRILCKQHPLGAKFAQEIESYTGTDPELRLGLQDVDVKAGVDLGPRWQTMHLLEAATKDSPTVLEYKNVGRVLGGGSVQINVELINNLHEDREAIALLRDNVNDRANRQYRIFGRTLEAFAKRNSGFEGLTDILNSSYKNLKIETNYSNAKTQSANAQNIYKDGVIEADGRSVYFSAVDFRGSSDKFKLYTLAKGAHFNDLPVDTENERSIKKAAAKAIITRELTAMMRGQAIDSDRHGKQQKIRVDLDGNLHVINFDDGAVAIDPPSIEEKQVLGRIIGKCLQQMLYEKREISEAIMEVTKEYSGTEHGNYVETSKRALRTMFGDYMNASYIEADGNRKTLLDTNDVKEIASAVLRAGKIDKNIIYPAAREIGYKAMTEMHKGTVSQKVMGIINAAGTFVQRIFKGQKRKPNVTVKDSGEYLEKIIATKTPEKQQGWKDKLEDKAAELLAKSAGNAIS